LLSAQVPAKTMVEEQVMVTGEQGLQYSLSSKGQHLAAVALRGSRKVMVHDGTDGPRFDDIPEAPGTGSPVIWSDDGARLAYIARAGQEFVIMVDGKEHARGPWADANSGANQPTVQSAAFTPGGKHFWFVRKQSDATLHTFQQLVIDGKPGPVSNAVIQPVWSNDGEHHA
jgi:Tol biopolymer transport system component